MVPCAEKETFKTVLLLVFVVFLSKVYTPTYETILWPLNEDVFDSIPMFLPMMEFDEK